jgi:hypothetical protein
MHQPKQATFSKHTDDAWVDWCQTRDQIGQKLREFYRANMTEELPPRLLAALKKLDEELPQAHQ